MSEFDNGISNSSGPVSAAEPSMDEILASIRRILNDEDSQLPANADIDEDVLVLDASMQAQPVDFSSGTEPPPQASLVAPHPDAAGGTAAETRHFSSESTFSVQAYGNEDAAGDRENQAQSYPTEPEDHMAENVEPPQGMMSEEASSAAASSIGALVRSISADRAVAVSRGGITIEDIVREEIRPVLKAWLDTHLPSLVERLVRAEIARVVERGTS